MTAHRWRVTRSTTPWGILPTAWYVSTPEGIAVDMFPTQAHAIREAQRLATICGKSMAVPTLGEHLARHIIDEPNFACSCGWEAGVGDTWPAHVADTWREARTITTVQQLAGLPGESLLRDATGLLGIPASSWDCDAFPARVLWQPADEEVQA